jgi:hypothetical protein
MYVRITPHEPRICPECDKAYIPARCDAITCSPRCRKARYRRLQALRLAVPLDPELAAIERVLIAALD